MQSGASVLKFCCSSALAVLVSTLFAASAAAVDVPAAERVVKDNKCSKCHALDRKKDGPAFRDVAAKFKPQPDAVKKLVHHVTSGEKVKFSDGHEEKHKQVKVKDQAELDNLVQWILSLEGGTKY